MRNISVKKVLIGILLLVGFTQCNRDIKGLVVSKRFEKGHFEKSMMFTGKMMLSTKKYDDPDWVVFVNSKLKNGSEKVFRLETDTLTYSKINVNDSVLVYKKKIIKFWRNK